MQVENFDRALIAYSFECALDDLWDGKSILGAGSTKSSICSALPVGPGGDMARAVIMERLGGFFSVPTWLVKNGYMTDAERYSNQVRIQEYRRAWVQSLIEEFSE